MASDTEIAELAIKLAEDFLRESRDRIVDVAEGDTSVLTAAAEMVRLQSTDVKPSSHSVEHLAFSLITAAHEEIRQRYTAEVKQTLAKQPPNRPR
jgi:acetylornithine/succinyldiaminopimelate/putrescine aminotransferase